MLAVHSSAPASAFVRVVLTLTTTLILAACGGGGNNNAAPAAPPALALPNLADASDQSFTAGTAITALVFTNNGGGSLLADNASPSPGCVAPNLPAGLMIRRTANGNQCQITGTPTMATTAAVTVTITATNATGADASPATVKITVAVDTTAPTVTSPAVASGTITATTASLSLTSSEAGTVKALVLPATDPAPDAAAIKAASASDPNVFSATITNANAATAVGLSGLTVGTGYTVYYLVTDSAGNEAAVASVMFTTATSPRAGAAPMLASISGVRTLNRAVAVTAGDRLTFINTGGGQLHADDAATPGCSASGNPPAGLMISRTTDGDSCEITGIPTMITTTPVTVTVTATNATGTSTATVSIAVEDTRAPIISGAAVRGRTASTALVSFTSDEDGTAYVLVLARDAGDSFTPAAVRTDAKSQTTGVTAGVAASVSVSMLDASTDYTAYIVVTDTVPTTPNDSNVVSVDFETTNVTDNTRPRVTASSIGGRTDTSAELSITSDEAGDIRVVVLPFSAPIPANAQAIKDNSGVITAVIATANTAVTVGLSQLEAGTTYRAHFFVTDSAGNDSEVTSVGFTTLTAPDNDPPTITNSSLSGVTDTVAVLTVTSNEVVTVHAVALPASVDPPTAVQIKGHTNVVVSVRSSRPGASVSLTLIGLMASTAYKAYFVATDLANNDSTVTTSTEFTTSAAPDSTLPVVESFVVDEEDIKDVSAVLAVDSSEAGEIFVQVLSSDGSSGAAPTTSAAIRAAVMRGAAGVFSAPIGGASSRVVVSLGGLMPETSYTAYFTVLDNADNVAVQTSTNNEVFSATFTTRKMAPAPPSAPTLMVVDGAAVNVMWSADGTSVYRIYRGTSLVAGEAMEIRVSPAIETSYRDAGLSASTTYHYWIRACDPVIRTLCSDFSARASATTGPPAPAAPAAAVDNTALTVALTWTGVGATVTYEVFRGTNNDSTAATTTRLAQNISTTSYNDTSLAAGTSYYYWIKACDANICSDFGSSVSAVFQPAAPAIPTLTVVSATTINVEWVAVSGAVAYEVFRGTSNDSGAATTMKLAQGVSAISHRDMGLVAGTGYYYWIKACNTGGCSGFSPVAMATASLGVPVLSYTYEDSEDVVPIRAGAAVSIVLDNTGGGRLLWCVAQNLPDGMMVSRTADLSSCQITGTTPDRSALPESDIMTTVTATNAAGSSEPFTVSIQRRDGAGLENNRATVYLTVGARYADDPANKSGARTLAVLRNTAESLSSCEIAETGPALPEGLTVSPDSVGGACIITGTPATYAPTREYTVVATHTPESFSVANIKIKIITGSMPDILWPAYHSNPEQAGVTLERGFNYAGRGAWRLINRGGAPQATGGCVANGTLPSGISFGLSADGETCAFSGTTNASFLASAVTLRVINDSGTSEREVLFEFTSLQTQMPTAPASGRSTDLRTFLKDGKYVDNPQIPASVPAYHFGIPFQGGSISSCGLSPDSPALPPGLSLIPASDFRACTFVGVPTAVSSRQAYTVIASNSQGDSEAAVVRIEVIDASGVPTRLAAASRSLTVGQAVLPPIRFGRTGTKLSYFAGAGDCEVDAASPNPLPMGLSVGVSEDGETCEITGTPAETTSGEIMVRIRYPNLIATTTRRSGTDVVGVGLTVNSASP